MSKKGGKKFWELNGPCILNGSRTVATLIAISDFPVALLASPGMICHSGAGASPELAAYTRRPRSRICVNLVKV